MNTLKKFLNWFTNNDLREDVESLEKILYSEEDYPGLMEDVFNLECRVHALEAKIKTKTKTQTKSKKTKSK